MVPSIQANTLTYGHTVEAVSESLPQFYVISSFAFVVKSINSIDASAFVIPPQQEYILWILHLVGQH